MATLREWDFENAWDLVDFFELSQFCTDEKYVAQAVGRNSFIFRGVASLEYKNEPAAFRANVDGRNFCPEAPSPSPLGFDDDRKKRDWFVSKLSAELRSVRIFVETADSVGLSTSLDYAQLEMAFSKTFRFLTHKDDLKRQLAEIGEMNFPPPYLERAFALAQHHGVPTRLLDFTESPLVAAYFAALKASSVTSPCARHEMGRIAVYFLSHEALPKPWLRMVSAPRYDND